MQAHHWAILFKRVVHFKEETRAFIRLHMEAPATLASENDVSLFRSAFKLRIFNNDTMEEV